MSTQTRSDSFVGEATYKGRVYPCLFIGETKWGTKAKLCFHDNPANTWWVNQADCETLEEFPTPVDPADYQRPIPAAEPTAPDTSATDDSRETDDDETPAYCAHCGQRFPEAPF